MVDLAVIIVTWNVRSLALDLLRTLFEDLEASKLKNNLNSRVLVVDNLSSDGTAEAIRTSFPAVTLLAQDRNLGVAAGNNVALRALEFNAHPTTHAQ